MPRALDPGACLSACEWLEWQRGIVLGDPLCVTSRRPPLNPCFSEVLLPAPLPTLTPAPSLWDFKGYEALALSMNFHAGLLGGDDTKILLPCSKTRQGL